MRDPIEYWSVQISVWGDYGRMDRRYFMGVAQVALDELDLNGIVIGWYKLFTTSSLAESRSQQQNNTSTAGTPVSAPGDVLATPSAATTTSPVR